MKVLVTGAGGFLGVGVTKSLIEKGHDVIAVSSDVSQVDPRAITIESNIFSVQDPYESYGKPEVILHMAWKDGFNHDSNSHMANLENHCLFLEKCMESPCERVCCIGSMHEVGYFEGSIKADTPCNPMSCYGIAKNALRQYLAVLGIRYGKPWLWLRGFYIVSSDPRGCSIFSKIAQAESEGITHFPFTSGKNQYDFLDYDVFCDMVAAAATSVSVEGVHNICSGYPESLGSRVERFIIENGFKITLDYGRFPDRPYDSPAVWGSVSVNDANMR